MSEFTSSTSDPTSSSVSAMETSSPSSSIPQTSITEETESPPPRSADVNEDNGINDKHSDIDDDNTDENIIREGNLRIYIEYILSILYITQHNNKHRSIRGIFILTFIPLFYVFSYTTPVIGYVNPNTFTSPQKKPKYPSLPPLSQNPPTQQPQPPSRTCALASVAVS